jgi:hypothetical protein
MTTGLIHARKGLTVYTPAVASDDSEEQLLKQIRACADALLAGLTRDADSLRESADPSHAEGATLWDQAAADARRMIADLDAKPQNERPQP